MDPHIFLERFLADAENPKVRGESIAQLRQSLSGDGAQMVAELLPRLIVADLDYATACALQRLLKALKQAAPCGHRGCKIAVLGTVTTRALIDMLDLYLHGGHIEAQFYEAGFATIQQEFLDPQSDLHRFEPDFVIVIPTWRDLRFKPQPTDDRATVAGRVQAELDAWAPVWRIGQEQLKAQIIQCNFAAPPFRVMGNLEGSHPAAFGRYVSLVNLALAEAAPSSVSLHDLDQLAAAAGRWSWADERYEHYAKLPCAPSHLPDLAHSLAAIILAQRGVARKCLVLDLDNTLWGGTIGDEGLMGIRLGHAEPEGEAFVSFQRYVKSLAERGVILAVCSKNEEKIARQVFEEHPDMVLRSADIACFIANWDDKPANLARIAASLNIGLDSLVLFDDNAAERSMVRRLTPEVAVPEVPADPAYFIRALDRHRYFEALAISAEDLHRHRHYQAEHNRQALASSAKDLNGFLQSLHMKAVIAPLAESSLERSAQLINRSNQFNLTTRRYSNAALADLLANPQWLTRTVSLSDRFADSGLISVVLAREDGDALTIDTWLMSCRVLQRGVERLLLNNIAAHAASRGLRRILGEFIATPKNALVRDHYRNLGFAPRNSSSADHGLWELRLEDCRAPLEHFIAVDDNGA